MPVYTTWDLAFNIFRFCAACICNVHLSVAEVKGSVWQIIWQKLRLLFLNCQRKVKGTGMLLTYFLNWKIWNETLNLQLSFQSFYNNHISCSSQKPAWVLLSSAYSKALFRCCSIPPHTLIFQMWSQLSPGAWADDTACHSYGFISSTTPASILLCWQYCIPVVHLFIQHKWIYSYVKLFKCIEDLVSKLLWGLMEGLGLQGKCKCLLLSQFWHP